MGLIERYRTIITDMKGVVVKIEKWGQRKLAYEIKKQIKGYYILIDFVGISAIVVELERNFKIDDMILKFITVKKGNRVDPKEIENEITAAGKEVEEETSRPSEVKTTETETDKRQETVTEDKTNGGDEESTLPEGTEEDRRGNE